MKKVLLTALAIVSATFIMTSCSNVNKSESFVFSKAALKAESTENSVDFSYNTRTTITKDKLDVSAFGEDDTITSSGEFSFNGVSLGDNAGDFINAFSITSQNAMWETCLVIREGEVLYDYPAFKGMNNEINFGKYDDVFLTAGYYTKKADANNDVEQWYVLGYEDLYNFWNLEQPKYQSDETGDICFISAGFDESGNIDMIDVYYGSMQAFEENEHYYTPQDYFAESYPEE